MSQSTAPVLEVTQLPDSVWAKSCLCNSLSRLAFLSMVRHELGLHLTSRRTSAVPAPESTFGKLTPPAETRPCLREAVAYFAWLILDAPGFYYRT